MLQKHPRFFIFAPNRFLNDIMNRRLFLRSTILTAAGTALASRTGFGTLFPIPEGSIEFEGENVLERILEKAGAQNWREKPIGDLMGAIGMELLDTPYVGGTLELYDDREVCSANFLKLDCVTFFESVLAVARAVKLGSTTSADVLEQLRLMRYRDGVVTDYTSRLHYVSEWYTDNESKKIVTVITPSLPGAEKYDKRIDFMSTHVDAYKQLKANTGMVEKIREIEKRLNGMERYYVPKREIGAAEKDLRTGDIVAITTTIPGLDVSHTGLCYRDAKGTLRLLHASLTKKKVTLDARLHDYLAGNTKQTGIMVARPSEA